MDTLYEILQSLWTLDGVKVIVFHTLINVAFAVAAAQKEGNFKFTKLLDFLGKKLTPYVLGYAAVKYFGMDAGLDGLSVPVWVLIEYTLTANLADSLSRLGVPMPDVIAARLGK